MQQKNIPGALEKASQLSYTPLIDLAMLLLVTFIITIPLMEQGIHVNLPRGKADELKAQQARTITINIEGKLYLDNREVTFSELDTEMMALGMSDPDITMFVRADKELKYERIIDIMKILHNAHISRMALVTQAE